MFQRIFCLLLLGLFINSCATKKVKKVEIINSFYPSEVHLIGQNENVWLFRGPDPIKDGKFAYTELRETMIKRSQETDNELPEDFFMTDLNISKTNSETIRK